MTAQKRFMTFKAQTSLQAVYESPDSPALFGQTLGGTLTWQQRDETTVEKALRSPGLAPQWVASLLALNASVIVGGELQPLADFLHQKGRREKIEALQVPHAGTNRTWGEAHVARTPADPPIVAAIAVVDWAGSVVRDVRLALTGVWHVPVQLVKATKLLMNNALDDDLIRQAAAAVQQEVSPPDNFLGSADYRREMAAVLTRRALQACKEQDND